MTSPNSLTYRVPEAAGNHLQCQAQHLHVMLYVMSCYKPPFLTHRVPKAASNHLQCQAQHLH
jgi:hypothetical protein